MRKLLSISALLQATIGLMAVVLVASFAISAEHAFRRREVADRVFAIAGISRDLFTAMQNLRVERGTVGTALATSAVADEDMQSEIAALRAQSGKALDSALAKLAAHAFAGMAPELREIRENRDTFVKVRREADAALEQPKEQRPDTLSANWVAAGGRLVDAMDRLSERLSGDIIQADPFIAEMMKIKQLGWVVRDAAGFDRLLLGEAIANGKGLSVERQQQFAVLTARMEQAWHVVQDDARRPATPARLTAAIDTAQQMYFTELRARRQEIIDDLAAGKPAKISGGEWVKLSNPGLESVIMVANTAFDLTESYAADQAAAAEADFHIAVALMVLFLCFGVLTALFVITRVARPMAKITEAMRAVAKGDLACAIPFERRADEVGDLARALAVFRDNALEKQRMEAGEAQRNMHKMEALGTLAGGIAHDLNNTLMPILALSRLVMEEMPEGSNAREDLELVVRASGRARDMVGQILAFSRSESVAQERLDLAAIVANSVRLLRPVIPANIALDAAVATQPLGVIGNASQLDQVVMNLCTNAVHAIGGRAGRIEISLDRERRHGEAVNATALKAGDYARLRVSDDGGGMDEATRQRIFEPFFTTKPVGEGTGMGLAIVQRVVASHGGAITVTSRPGEGTRFDVYLPLASAEATPLRRPAALAAEGRGRG